MKFEDFHIGLLFKSPDRPHRPWRCTDIGYRVIVAVQVDYLRDGTIDGFYDDPERCLESVFRAHEMERCTPIPDAAASAGPQLTQRRARLMRTIIILAALAVFFPAGVHAEDWSLSTWQQGPRSPSAYGHATKAKPKWRATAHHRKQRVEQQPQEKPDLRLYRAEDKPQIVTCQPPVRGLGTQWVGNQGALDAAKKDWMERVRYDLGESYLDMANAADETHRCGRVSIGEALGQVMYRCEIKARPCKGVFTAK